MLLADTTPLALPPLPGRGDFAAVLPPVVGVALLDDAKRLVPMLARLGVLPPDATTVAVGVTADVARGDASDARRGERVTAEVVAALTVPFRGVRIDERAACPACAAVAEPEVTSTTSLGASAAESIDPK